MVKKTLLLFMFLLMVVNVSAGVEIHYLCCAEYDYCICDLEKDLGIGVEPVSVESENNNVAGSSGLSVDKFISKFIPVIKRFFVPISDYQALEDRVFLLEARLELLDQGYLFLTNKTQSKVLFHAANLKRFKYNLTNQVYIGEYNCQISYGMDICGRLIK